MIISTSKETPKKIYILRLYNMTTLIMFWATLFVC